MNWSYITKNWKTTLAGLVTFLMSVPAFVGAIQSVIAHQPVDWRSVALAVALAAGGGGLVAAKDASNHSTQAEVLGATLQDNLTRPPAGMSDGAVKK